MDEKFMPGHEGTPDDVPDDAPEQDEEPEVVAHSDDAPGRRWYIGYTGVSPQEDDHPSAS
jgi:hypothetical protein